MVFRRLRLRMNCRRIPLLLFIASVAFIMTVYMVYFKHGPPEKILAANKRHNDYLEKVLSGSDEIDPDVLKSAKTWQTFMNTHNYVSIGDIYSDCEGDDRLWLGKVALMQDKLRGGVTSKTFVNVTFTKELTAGEFFLSVKYGGKDLYENKWEFCKMEEEENDDDDERYIFCPYKTKAYSWSIERKIPNFLPKGSYYAKAWLLDDDEEMIMCGEANFVL